MKNLALSIFAAVSTVGLLAGCAEQIHELRLDARHAVISVAKRYDIGAALLVTPASAAYLPSRKPDEIYSQGSGLSYVIPLGKALREASHGAFRPIFRGVAIIDSLEAGNDFDIVIEPTIKSFHYRFPLIAAFTAMAVVRLEMELNVYRGGRKIWAKTFATPEIKGPVYGASIGRSRSGSSLEKAASESLTEALEMGAADLMRDGGLNKVFAELETGGATLVSGEKASSRRVRSASKAPKTRTRITRSREKTSRT